MERRADNILCHELIGLEAIIESYPDPQLEGLRGTIAFETARSLEFRVGGRKVKALKPGLLLAVSLDGEWVRVRGDDLGDPLERAKRALRGDCGARA